MSAPGAIANHLAKRTRLQSSPHQGMGATSAIGTLAGMSLAGARHDTA
jgi:hypothetical protein